MFFERVWTLDQLLEIEMSEDNRAAIRALIGKTDPTEVQVGGHTLEVRPLEGDQFLMLQSVFASLAEDDKQASVTTIITVIAMALRVEPEEAAAVYSLATPEERESLMAECFRAAGMEAPPENEPGQEAVADEAFLSPAPSE